jgi:glycosyltransferase involved in cell wall biosynthesis
VHLHGVLEALVARGHDVTLAVERDDGSAPAPCRVVIGFAELDRLADGADLVHVHNALDPALLGWAADRGAVATVQDHRSFCPGRGKLTLAGATCSAPMDRTLCAACFDDAAYHARIHDVTDARLAALRRMRGVVVLSEYMRRELALVGVDTRVIPPFVHALAPAAPSGEPCVLFVGRLVAAKGVDDAVRAHALSGVAIPLVFAGSGSLRNTLTTHEVLGWLDRAALAAAYARARAVVLPSRWQEPFGIAGLEALSLGIPVAAWQSGGVEEWHPGGELLVAWGDVDALAQAIARAVEAPPAAPRRAFEREALMAALETLYCDTLGA